MNTPYNYTKSIKDKEQKILNYYKRISNINNIDQPKIFIVPKRKKGTKKNIARDNKDIVSNDDQSDTNKLIENHIKSEKDEKDEKKLTKKRIVIMDD